MSGTDILSRIQILLDANTANFEQKMKGAQDTSVSTFDKIKSSAKVMGTAVAAGAASAAIALSAMAWETANHAVELEKYALRANTTTQDFQKMAVGAQAYGVEQEKLSDMMKDFNEKLGELTTIGAGGGVDFFEQIAVKTEGSAAAAEKLILKMQKLSGPEALQLYVNKLEEAGVTQQQMSFYLESMASDMTDLIPLLVNGGEGMQLYSDAAERAGLVMSDETIAQAKILKEQMYLLDLQLQGVKNQLMQAVVPAFVDIAQAFFGSSEQGLQFTDVADGIAESLRFVAKMAIGVVTNIQLAGKAMGAMGAVYSSIQNNKDWYEFGPLGYAKAMFDARGEIASIGKSYISDANETLLAAADKMDQITKGTASSTAAQMAGLRTVQQTTTGVNKGLGELTKKQTDAASATKNHSKEAEKLYEKLERLHEQQARDREQISKAYASDFQNLVWDEAEELERIRKAGFTSEEQGKYIALAQKRFEGERAEYFKSLNLELFQYEWGEEQKLQYAYEMDREIAENDVKIADEVRQAKLKFLEEQYQYELKNIQLARDKRIFESNQSFMTSSEIMVKHYELERKEIEQTIHDIEERNAALNASYHNEDKENDSSRQNVWKNYQGDQGGITAELVDVDSEFEGRNANIQAAYEWQLITQETYQNKMIENERAYHLAKANVQMQYGMSYIQGAAGVLAQVLGENSKAYQAMFAMQKAMAIAQVMMNAPATFSSVYASVSQIPYVGWVMAPVAAGAAVALQLAQAATIGSVSFNPVGMAHDGIDRIPEEGSWWLNKGERVLTDQTSSKLDRTLEDVRKNNGSGNSGNDMPMMQPEVNNIYALDGKSVERVLKKHSRHVAGSMKGYARNFGRYK